MCVVTPLDLLVSVFICWCFEFNIHTMRKKYKKLNLWYGIHIIMMYTLIQRSKKKKANVTFYGIRFGLNIRMQDLLDYFFILRVYHFVNDFLRNMQRFVFLC